MPALNAGEGPDIWAGGTGPGQPQAIIEAGHALDLTPYFCELGWNEIIPEEIVNYTSSDGKLWAIGDSVETTLLFYNKEIFAENGIEVPATWDELMAACDTLAAGRFCEPDRAGWGRQVSHFLVAVAALGPFRRSRGHRQRDVRGRTVGRGAVRASDLGSSKS